MSGAKQGGYVVCNVGCAGGGNELHHKQINTVFGIQFLGPDSDLTLYFHFHLLSLEVGCCCYRSQLPQPDKPALI